MQNAENIAAEAGENRISVVSILVFNRESAEKCGTGKFRAFLLRRIYHRQNGYTI